jgi:hypothetical protein
MNHLDMQSIGVRNCLESREMWKKNLRTAISSDQPERVPRLNEFRVIDKVRIFRSAQCLGVSPNDLVSVAGR